MTALRGIAKGLADEQKIDAPARGLDDLMAVLPGERLVPPWRVVSAHRSRRVRALAQLHPPRTPRRRDWLQRAHGAVVRRAGGPRAGSPSTRWAGCWRAWPESWSFRRSPSAIRPTRSGSSWKRLAAVVIGGGSLSGGQGSVAGTLIGALLLTVNQSRLHTPGHAQLDSGNPDRGHHRRRHDPRSRPASGARD